MEKEMSINFFREREREKMAINLLGLNECIFGNNDSKRKFMELYQSNKKINTHTQEFKREHKYECIYGNENRII